ncbi:HAD family hydrolase [Thioalkalivibrio sp. ALJ3]|uniref:HAD family hydrolase n=1 Tax=Thioalkalivibrio sp. ALJ3 TaxID=1240557 RepID=UPI00035CE263|nr:HAD-IA family hydrolase [Thioalkalivibrio sp. ALJ3]
MNTLLPPEGDALRLVVFDWDGTLMDSPRRIVHCLQRTCAALGQETPPESALRDIIGLGVEAAVQKLFPSADPAFVAAFAAIYRRCYLTATDAPETPMFAHVAPLLDWLDERGVLLGVATSKSRAGLDQALEATGLQGRFVATACGDEHPSKPSPVMLEHVMHRCGVERSRTRMVGDSVYDLRMARAAGVPSLAVAHGVHDDRRLADEHPLAVARDLKELLELLRQSEPLPED